jgi:hypothetical protein
MRPGIVVRIALVVALATVTTGLACAEGPLDSTGPKLSSKSLTGTWSGPIGALTMRLTLVESSGTVTGSGTMLQNGESFTLSVAGTSNNGAFSVTVSEASHDPFTYTGNVQVATGSPTTMVGVGNGAGLSNTPITLTKQ